MPEVLPGFSSPINAVHMTFQTGTEIAEIHNAITKLIGGLKPGGCTTCGLGGIDIVISSWNPGDFERVSLAAGLRPAVPSAGLLSVTPVTSAV
jgi:hypothetical protein